ncbi:MAG: NAD(P)/FAD-dependent oxidoreductase, partial [Cyclobacteriaceae bacterium]
MNDSKAIKVAIIGGGAAGFFSALSVKEHHPGAQVIIFEKTSKLLSKVKVSGGGRCNVTNSETKISELIKAYPRGAK